MSDVVLVSGSPSASSRTATVLASLADHLEKAGQTTSLLQVRELPSADLTSGRAQDQRTKDALAQIAGAKAVVIGTPIYKASLTGLLKSFLDLLPPDALKGKMAMAIGTGAAPAHALAIEHQMAPLLFALGADAVVRGQYFIDCDLADNQLTAAAAAALAAAGARLIALGGTR
jgi:FMN reductase